MLRNYKKWQYISPCRHIKYRIISLRNIAQLPYVGREAIRAILREAMANSGLPLKRGLSRKAARTTWSKCTVFLSVTRPLPLDKKNFVEIC